MRVGYQQRVAGYSGESDHKRNSTRAYEDQRIENNVMGEALKPVVHQ
jgi:hypothetical protein